MNMTNAKHVKDLSLLLHNLIIHLGIPDATKGLEILANQRPKEVPSYANDIDTVGNSVVRTQEMFSRTEKGDLTVNEDKTKYVHVIEEYDWPEHNHSQECVWKLQYVDSIIIADNDISSEIETRLQKINRRYL